jgi:phage FluMu protein Com
MNIYDTKCIYCSKCGKFIGEIDEDAVVMLPKCGKCVNPIPEGDDKALYLKSRYSNSQSENRPREMIVQ